jgi:hypothetical protein
MGKRKQGNSQGRKWNNGKTQTAVSSKKGNNRTQNLCRHGKYVPRTPFTGLAQLSANSIRPMSSLANLLA